MALQETFNSLREIEEHDQRGEEFLNLKDFSFLESKDKEKVIMTFKWGNQEKIRAVKVSVEDFKRIRAKVMEFYNVYESELFEGS